MEEEEEDDEETTTVVMMGVLSNSQVLHHIHVTA